MKKRGFNQKRFVSVPLVGILRYDGTIDCGGLADALIAGGLTTIEVSFTFPSAPRQLADLVVAGGGRLNIGAGTITTLERFRQARGAGADFVVTPSLVTDVMAECRTANLPFFPGAFSPTEIVSAHAAGATMVKLFPAVTLGPSFLRQFRAALPEIGLLPTGGIGLDQISAWRRAGADGLGLGGGLFPTELLRNGAWSELARHVRRYVDAWQQCALTDS